LPLYMWLFVGSLLSGIVVLLWVILTYKHQMLAGIIGASMFFGVPCIVFYILYYKRFKIWHKKKYEINQKAKQLNSSILAYAKAL